MVEFKATDEESATILNIARRAKKSNPALDVLTLQMDITATHCNGCPLKLDELLAADDFNFVHDVYGISGSINRATGQLENCFLPRFSK